MGILAFLSVTTLSPRLPYPPGKATLALIIPLIAMITIEEASQHFIQSRSFSFLDLACSIAGVLAASLPAHHFVSSAPFRGQKKH
jgi:hypothetical protein